MLIRNRDVGVGVGVGVGGWVGYRLMIKSFQTLAFTRSPSDSPRKGKGRGGAGVAVVAVVLEVLRVCFFSRGREGAFFLRGDGQNQSYVICDLCGLFFCFF